MQINTGTRTVDFKFEGTLLIATLAGKGGAVLFDDHRLRVQGDAPLLLDEGHPVGVWRGGWVRAEGDGFLLETAQEDRYFESVAAAVAYYAEGGLS